MLGGGREHDGTLPGLGRGALDNVEQARRAVVEQEVVAVGPVLGARVLLEVGKQALGGGGREGEALLDDRPAEKLVLGDLVGEGGRVEDIVQLAAREADHEKGLVEVERAEVVGPVQPARVAPDADRAVAEEAVDLLPGQHRQEGHRERVAGCGRRVRRERSAGRGGRPQLSRGGAGGDEEEQDEKAHAKRYRPGSAAEGVAEGGDLGFERGDAGFERGKI